MSEFYSPEVKKPAKEAILDLLVGFEDSYEWPSEDSEEETSMVLNNPDFDELRREMSGLSLSAQKEDAVLEIVDRLEKDMVGESEYSGDGAEEEPSSEEGMDFDTAKREIIELFADEA